MLTIDTTTMQICLTRGDSATIEFSAKDESGSTYVAESGDKLIFGVSKKYGGSKEKPSGFKITNVFDSCFYEVTPTAEEFAADKTSFFKVVNNQYVRCTASDTLPSPCYANSFWNIVIEPEDTVTYDDDGEVDTDNSLKFGDYYWDLQLVQSDEDVFTIIGKSDSLEPKFTVWGEVV